MKKVYLVLVTLALCHQISAQTQPAAPNAARSQVIGQVTSLDAAARRIVLQDDHGATLAVSVAENTAVLRVPPGETDIKKAAKIAFTDIGAGDRILAVGAKSEDGKELQARTLVIMSKADIAQKQQREQRDWQTRGIAGTVSAMDAAGKTLTVKAGQKTLTIQTAEQTEYRRYAPDSVKFSDTVASSFAEIKPGDQIRVLGDKQPDGVTIKAERMVSGSFRQIAATISSIHPESGEIKVNDLAGKKPVTISVNSSTTLKKLSPAIAARLSQRFQVSPASDAPAAPAGRGGREDLGQLLDRLPAVSLADLKPGDAIMVSGSGGGDLGHLTAISLLAGVEPLLTASPNATRDIMAGWNFGGDNAQE
jgi:transcription antitermination factor NusG